MPNEDDLYFDVRRVSLAVLPGLRHTVERSVCVIELASLQVKEEAGERFETEKPVESEGGGGVVSAVVEGRDLVVLPRLVTLLEEGATCRVQRSDRLKQQNDNLYCRASKYKNK